MATKIIEFICIYSFRKVLKISTLKKNQLSIKLQKIAVYLRQISARTTPYNLVLCQQQKILPLLHT